MSAGAGLALFDLDGTLVETADLYLSGVPRVVREHLGHDVAVGDYVDLWGQDVRTWFARAAGDAESPVVDEMYAAFEAYYVAHHGRCAAYPGVAEGLAALEDRGYRIGVVTTRPQRRAELVRDFPWSSAIDVVVGGDRVARRKPAPDSLDLAVDLLGSGRSEGRPVYVGDTALDVRAARASTHAVLGVAALWGSRDRAALMAAHPDHAFETFGDCVDWLIDRRTEPRELHLAARAEPWACPC